MPTIAGCTVAGHLYGKPEPLKGDKGGCRFRMWTQDRIKEDGEWVKVFSSHSVVVFNKNEAEWLMRDGDKGTIVAVTGTFRLRSWEKDGKANCCTEIIAQTARILERTDDGDGQPKAAARPAASAAAASYEDEPPF